jgi:hypothetical protein
MPGRKSNTGEVGFDVIAVPPTHGVGRARVMTEGIGHMHVAVHGFVTRHLTLRRSVIVLQAPAGGPE